MRQVRRGFTLIELMIVVAVIAVIASLAIPNMLASRMAANESAAIATMRQLTSCQAQVKTAAVIDGDGDGVGEYGYFGELAGTHTVRAFIAGAQALSATIKVAPPVASSAFGKVVNSRCKKSGYYFQLWLPSATGLAVAEAPNGGADPSAFPDPNACETYWCAYAWPVAFNASSNRVFFVNEQGDILQSLNTNTKYSNVLAPPPEAAFASGGTVNSIAQPTANTAPTKVGMDGEAWTNVN